MQIKENSLELFVLCQGIWLSLFPSSLPPHFTFYLSNARSRTVIPHARVCKSSLTDPRAAIRWGWGQSAECLCVWVAGWMDGQKRMIWEHYPNSWKSIKFTDPIQGIFQHPPVYFVVHSQSFVNTKIKNHCKILEILNKQNKSSTASIWVSHFVCFLLMALVLPEELSKIQ